MNEIKKEKIKLIVSGTLTILAAVLLILLMFLNLTTLKKIDVDNPFLAFLIAVFLTYGNIIGFIICAVIVIFGIVQLIFTAGKGNLVYSSTGLIVVTVVLEILAILFTVWTFFLALGSGTFIQAAGLLTNVLMIGIIILQSILFFKKNKKDTVIGGVTPEKDDEKRRAALMKFDPEKEYAEQKRRLDNFLRQGTYDQKRYEENLAKLENDYKAALDSKKQN